MRWPSEKTLQDKVPIQQDVPGRGHMVEHKIDICVCFLLGRFLFVQASRIFVDLSRRVLEGNSLCFAVCLNASPHFKTF